MKVKCDADWAGNADDLKSTTGFRITWCGMKIISSSTTQPGLPALSSGESEVRSMAKSGTEAIYVKEVFSEMGILLKIWMYTDASAALANASKLGPGRIRHLEVQSMWLKDAIRRRILAIGKIGSKQNNSDVLTKHVNKETLTSFMEELGLVSLKKMNLTYIMLQYKRINTIDQIRNDDVLAKTEQYKDVIGGIFEVSVRNDEIQKKPTVASDEKMAYFMLFLAMIYGVVCMYRDVQLVKVMASNCMSRCFKTAIEEPEISKQIETRSVSCQSQTTYLKPWGRFTPLGQTAHGVIETHVHVAGVTEG